jgi:hypothetical protein
VNRTITMHDLVDEIKENEVGMQRNMREGDESTYKLLKGQLGDLDIDGDSVIEQDVSAFSVCMCRSYSCNLLTRNRINSVIPLLYHLSGPFQILYSASFPFPNNIT